MKVAVPRTRVARPLASSARTTLSPPAAPAAPPAAARLHTAAWAAVWGAVAGEAEWPAGRGPLRKKAALFPNRPGPKSCDVPPANTALAYREGPATPWEGGVEVDGTRIPAGKIV